MRKPIQQRLLLEGYANTPRQAAALLIGGRVYVDGRPARSGQLVKPQARIQVSGVMARYGAKGGYKLEGALKDFAIRVPGRVCVDAGASTGGFSDCLLKHGAGLVYAVDTGFGQLLGSLRQDPRVRNLERTNIGDASLLRLDPRPDLGTVDLSYLSLRKAVPQFQAILHEQGELVCLVKPLFETDDMEARRTGQLPETAYGPLLENLVSHFNGQPGLSVRGVTHSPVTGSAGTLEFFLHVTMTDHPGPDLRRQIAASVDAALALPLWSGPDSPP